MELRRTCGQKLEFGSALLVRHTPAREPVSARSQLEGFGWRLGTAASGSFTMSPPRQRRHRRLPLRALGGQTGARAKRRAVTSKLDFICENSRTTTIHCECSGLPWGVPPRPWWTARHAPGGCSTLDRQATRSRATEFRGAAWPEREALPLGRASDGSGSSLEASARRQSPLSGCPAHTTAQSQC